MQIHELDDFIGAISDDTLLAIDDGTETTKVPATALGVTTEMTLAEAETGTGTEPRVITPKVLHDFIENQFEVVTETFSITRTGGAAGSSVNTSETKFTRCGKTVSALIAITPATESIAAGGNIYTGTLDTVKLRPSSACRLVAYLGSRPIIAALASDGTITVRNTSATALTMTGTLYVAGTYLVN